MKDVKSGGWVVCHCTMCFLRVARLVWSASGNYKFLRWTGLGFGGITGYEVGCNYDWLL